MGVEATLNIRWSPEETLMPEVGASQVQGRAAGEKGSRSGQRTVVDSGQ